MEVFQAQFVEFDFFITFPRILIRIFLPQSNGWTFRQQYVMLVSVISDNIIYFNINALIRMNASFFSLNDDINANKDN